MNDEHSLANPGLQEYYDTIGFSGRVGFGSRPALAVIDLAIAWTDPDSLMGTDRLEPVVANTLVLLAVARRAGIPVFFTVMAYDSEMAEVGKNVLAKTRHLSMLVRGSKWTELHPDLNRQPGEPLIVKPRASAFFATTFLSQLIARDVDTLVITGCSTSGCIRATAEGAFDHNFRTIVVREAVGDRSESAHRANLFDIDARYADVVSMDEALAAISAFHGPDR
jgi:maleamate amidohydrolase